MVAAMTRSRSAVQRLPTLARPQLWLPLLSLAIVLGTWEIVGRSIDPLLFAPPSRVMEAFADLLATGDLVRAASTTLQALIVGYLLAIATGVPAGVAMGVWAGLGRILQPYLYGVFATPRVVVVPLIIVWFGIGYTARVFLVFLWSAIAIATNTAAGVRNVRPDLVDVARSFGASRIQMARHVLIPGAIPFVVAGLRIGAERAMVGVIIGEMFLQITGLGGLIEEASERFRPAEMLCAVVVVALIGTILVTGLDALERRVQNWRADGA